MLRHAGAPGEILRWRFGHRQAFHEGLRSPPEDTQW